MNDSTAARVETKQDSLGGVAKIETAGIGSLLTNNDKPEGKAVTEQNTEKVKGEIQHQALKSEDQVPD